ncbi:MAG: hypothetical protein IPJ81_00390 [Chitinophagaceae bacterium]|nr:hypothetical protein [Chitinophagaceae bacterium]
MEIQIKLIGASLIFLALIHIIFPKYFNWQKELVNISLVNRQMIYVHTFFIALALLLMGLLCITSARDLMATKLGSKLALGLGVFWITRLLIQFFGYSSKLWKGKAFETIIHILFSILWTYISAIFFYIYWLGKDL